MYDTERQEVNNLIDGLINDAEWKLECYDSKVTTMQSTIDRLNRQFREAIVRSSQHDRRYMTLRKAVEGLATYFESARVSVPDIGRNDENWGRYLAYSATSSRLKGIVEDDDAWNPDDEDEWTALSPQQVRDINDAL